PLWQPSSASLADGVVVRTCWHSSSSFVKLRQYLCVHTRGVSSSIPSSKGTNVQEEKGHWIVQEEWDVVLCCSSTLPLVRSIYVRVYEDRIDLLRAAIVGPSGTPYHDGLFFFDVRFPPEYPRCPSKVYYHSGGLRLNPNLYESGKKWSKSNSTMLQVLISIQGLVLNDKPYFNEPGYKNTVNTPLGEKHSMACNQTAFVLPCKTMLYSLRKPPKHFETLVVHHFHERERAILESCSAYASGIVVGSSVRDGAKYARDKCFAGFKKSLEDFGTKFCLFNNVFVH
ncbi:hypothetical protein ZWY2020_024903, partial [Hordeum vulgare]